MWFAKAEEPLSDIELAQRETTPSRCEEDQVPFARYDSRSSSQKNFDRPECCCGFSRRIGGIIWLFIICALIAVVATPTIMHEKHKRKIYKGSLGTYGYTIPPDVHGTPVGFHELPVGACGHTPSDYDVQISSKIFADPTPGSNLSASCGRTLQASVPGGISYTFTVYDKCPECGSADLSVSDIAGAYLVNSADSSDGSEDATVASEDATGNFEKSSFTVTWYWLTPTPSN